MKLFAHLTNKNTASASPFRRVALFLILMITAGLFSNLPAPITASASEVNPDAHWPAGPDVSAPAAIVMEANTGVVLYSKDIYTAYYPASITKVMTSLLAFQNSNLNEIMTMTVDAEMKVYGSRVGLVRGESVTMESVTTSSRMDIADKL